MEQEILEKINKRLELLEQVHTRYQGPPRKKGDRGESGPTGRDGRDSTELETLRAERNAFREELNAFRKELHQFRVAACMEMQKLAADYEQRLSEIFDKEVGAFCELRDKSCAEIAERLARLQKAK